jgi:magnesium transporter
MFRVLEFRAGRVGSSEGPDRVGPPPEGASRWIDLRAPDPQELELLRQRFDFHPLTIEDCSHLDQRPKVEEFRDYTFIVTQGFACEQEQVRDLALVELHAFLGERFLVTVRAGDIASLDQTWSRVTTEPGLIERGVDFVYYLVADGLVDATFPILDRIADELDEIEDAVLDAPGRDDLQRIFDLKRHLVVLRRVLSPQRDVLGLLTRRGDARIAERTAVYLRDVYDHLVRINEAIEVNRDLLGNALDAYRSAVAQRTNDVMKRLTILSAIFLPLAFVVGFFGQNFANLAGVDAWVDSDGLMWTMVALCVGVPIAMLAWFRSRDWL